MTRRGTRPPLRIAALPRRPKPSERRGAAYSPTASASAPQTAQAPRTPSGFTLVELILVLALLATIMAVAAPMLSRSVRERRLEQEAARVVALTEYGRGEAISQGVPMVLWIDSETGRYGLEPKTAYAAIENRRREYTLENDIRFDRVVGAKSDRGMDVAEFSPEGTPEPSSIDVLRLTDRFESIVLVARTEDGWGYEVVKGEKERAAAR